MVSGGLLPRSRSAFAVSEVHSFNILFVFPFGSASCFSILYFLLPSTLKSTPRLGNRNIQSCECIVSLVSFCEIYWGQLQKHSNNWPFMSVGLNYSFQSWDDFVMVKEKGTNLDFSFFLRNLPTSKSHHTEEGRLPTVKTQLAGAAKRLTDAKRNSTCTTCIISSDFHATEICKSVISEVVDAVLNQEQLLN